MVKRSSKKRISIQSLPLEIIMQICNEIDSLAKASLLDHLRESMEGQGLNPDPNDPNNFMTAMMNGLMEAVGLPGAPRPAGGVGVGARPPTNPVDDDPGDPDEMELPAPSTFLAELSAAANAQAQAQAQASGEIVESTTASHEQAEEESEEEEEDMDMEEEEDRIEETYPDGLPVDPLLPLALVSRPFLHAARLGIYRRCSIVSVFQASLLLRSLSTIRSAASDASVTDPNILPTLVRSICFRQSGVVSLGRGGAEVYIDILKLCKNLEELVIIPEFLRSATIPFLEALKDLTKLKAIDIQSSRDPTHAFLLTTPRLVELLECHWLEMEDLTITRLREAGEGPPEEDEAMWDREYEEEEESEEEESEEEESENDGESNSDSQGDEDYSENNESTVKNTTNLNTAESIVEEEGVIEKKQPKGLKRLALFDVDAPFDELNLILKHSKATLETLCIRPTATLSRYGMASIFLTYGANLRSLKIECAQDWWPLPKPVNRTPVPPKSKDYISGEPTDIDISNVGQHPYLLDAILPYLPKLSTLNFDGNLASTALFAIMPKSLNTLRWTHAQNISPSLLSKLMKKTVPKMVSYKRRDGSFGTKSANTKLASGLKCVTVDHDDLHWKQEDTIKLCEAMSERGICLHLSGDEMGMGGGMGMDMEDGPGVGGMAIPIPAGLAGLFNAMGGGIVAGGMPMGFGAAIPGGAGFGIGGIQMAMNGPNFAFGQPPAAPAAVATPLAPQPGDDGTTGHFDDPVVFGDHSVFALD